MAYPTITAGNIMDTAAVLNNDPAKTRYTYAKQIPFLNVALRALQRQFELNEMPVTAETSTILQCSSSTTVIDFTTNPTLPSNLVEPKLLWERPRGIDPFVLMTPLSFLPQQLSGVLTNDYIYYVWQSQQIKLLQVNQNNDIKMEYTKFLFTEVTNVDGSDTISVINAQGYLEFKTGALIASLLAENPTRAGELEGEAEQALEESLGISTKTRQNIATRHRPFRAGFKRGMWM